MKVLVTGATGSLGLPLCLALKKKNYQVIGVGRQPKRLQILKDNGVEVIQADLCENDLSEEVADCEFVIHSAALTRPWGPHRDFVAPNLTASRRVFEWASTSKIKKVIHISTTSVYYDGTSRTGLTETSPLPASQKTSYGATKLQSELIAQEFFKDGLPILTMRPRAIVSAYDQTLLPRLLPIMSRGFFPMIDDGAAVIDVTPVESICVAIENAMLAPNSQNGRTYNITNGEPISIRELLTSIASVLNLKVRWIPLKSAMVTPLAVGFEQVWSRVSSKEPRLSRYSLDLISKSQSFNIQKLKDELNFQPVISVKESLSSMKNWSPLA